MENSDVENIMAETQNVLSRWEKFFAQADADAGRLGETISKLQEVQRAAAAAEQATRNVHSKLSALAKVWKKK